MTDDITKKQHPFSSSCGSYSLSVYQTSSTGVAEDGLSSSPAVQVHWHQSVGQMHCSVVTFNTA